jgi:hypothetical protein
MISSNGVENCCMITGKTEADRIMAHSSFHERYQSALVASLLERGIVKVNMARVIWEAGEAG